MGIPHSLMNYSNLSNTRKKRHRRQRVGQAFKNAEVAIFGEVRRVLRDDGSLWVCMGDSYAGAGGAWTDGEKPRPRSRQVPVGYRPKDLILVGARLAMALQADGWLLRNAVVWRKKGIRPESAQDRFTRSYETIYLLTKGARYYFNQSGTREPIVTKPNASSDVANDGRGAADTGGRCHGPQNIAAALNDRGSAPARGGTL
jgi:DNA modification methylase